MWKYAPWDTQIYGVGGVYFYDTGKEKEVAMDTVDVGKGKQIDYR